MVPHPRRVEPGLPWRSALPVPLRADAECHLSWSTPSTTSLITGIKKGYECPAEQLGHIKLVGVTPTLCHLLGIQPPAQAQGAIAYDLLEGHEIARQRPNPTPQVEGFSDYKKWPLEHFYTKRLLSEESIPC